MIPFGCVYWKILTLAAEPGPRQGCSSTIPSPPGQRPGWQARTTVTSSPAALLCTLSSHDSSTPKKGETDPAPCGKWGHPTTDTCFPHVPYHYGKLESSDPELHHLPWLPGEICIRILVSGSSSGETQTKTLSGCLLVLSLECEIG